jgi:nitroimidazol reductase NimA-like FMN-containing flavoprotein (pyridoxamine 5'-phosphate oxidase superfamily)
MSPHQPHAATRNTPTFRTLEREECDAILARNNVGRIAFTHHDRVDIEPVHYVLDAGDLYVRTSEGSKLTVLAHHPWVAFEVDEVRGPFDWVSIVVHGTVYRHDAHGEHLAHATRLAYERAVAALRRHDPTMLSPDDPVPFRDVVLEIHIDRVTGRGAASHDDGE